MKKAKPNAGGETVPIASIPGLIEARALARGRAAEIGFTGLDVAMMAGAVSAAARDRGPGIADHSRAMRDGDSTSRGWGPGPAGSRRFIDDFAAESKAGRENIITMRKRRS